jgi:hypothetical protein
METGTRRDGECLDGGVFIAACPAILRPKVLSPRRATYVVALAVLLTWEGA